SPRDRFRSCVTPSRWPARTCPTSRRPPWPWRSASASPSAWRSVRASASPCTARRAWPSARRTEPGLPAPQPGPALQPHCRRKPLPVNPKIACDPALEGDPTIARIREALSAPGPFVFRDNLPLFREIFSSGIALRALRIALRRAVDDPDYQLPQFVMEGLIKGWTFLATEQFSISLG